MWYYFYTKSLLQYEITFNKSKASVRWTVIQQMLTWPVKGVCTWCQRLPWRSGTAHFRGGQEGACPTAAQTEGRKSLGQTCGEGQGKVSTDHWCHHIRESTHQGWPVQQALSIRHSLTLSHTAESRGHKVNCPLHPAIAQSWTHSGQSIKGLDFTYTYTHPQIFTHTNYNHHSLQKTQIKTNELIKDYE